MIGELCALESGEVSHFYQNLLGLSNQKIKLLLKHPELRQKNKNKAARILAREVLRIPLNFLNIGLVNPQYLGLPIEILYADEDLIALNKPAGVHGHPLHYTDQNNCLSFLRNKNYRDVLNVNIKSQERGMLYRLDGVTSGILIFARNENLFFSLRDKFQTHISEKTYLAIVEGNIKDFGRQQLYFSSRGVKGEKVIASSTEGFGNQGEIQLFPIYQSDKFSIVKILLKEGLRHQIRASLAYLGHPIVGDTVYGAQAEKRVYLHALNYNLLGKHFYAPLDLYFRDFLNFHCLMKMLHDQFKIF